MNKQDEEAIKRIAKLIGVFNDDPDNPAGISVAKQLKLERFIIQERQRAREDTSTVTRFEVVDETGRAYVRYDVAVSVSFQDNDQTLKVFIKPKQGEGEGV